MGKAVAANSRHRPVTTGVFKWAATRSYNAFPLVKRIFSTSRKGLCNAEKHLREHGWAVIGPIHKKPSLIRAKRELLWKDLAAIPGLKARGRGGFVEHAPKGFSGYIVRGNNISNGRLAWAIRQNAIIRRLYSIIDNVRDSSHMCANMDGIFLAVRGRSTKGFSFHRDAKAENSKKSFSSSSLSVQGIYTFTPVETPEDAGTVVVPGSHFRVDASWGHTVPEAEQKACRDAAIKPVVPADHLLVFNSRTIHGSTPQMHDRPGCINRLAVPVCFMPKAWRSESTLQLKRDTFLRQQCSFHRADDMFCVAHPARGETHWAAKHGFPHRTSRIPVKLVKGDIPVGIADLL